MKGHINMTNTNTLLVLIFVALIAVFGFMVYESNQDTPMENLTESVNEFGEEVSDEVDDAATN